MDLSSSASSGQYTFYVEGIGDFPFQSNTVNGIYPFLGNPRFHIIFEKVSVDNDKEKTLPNAYTIDRVYPNPFNPTVTIDYNLSNDIEISISVYDLKGALVDRLFKGKMVSGNQQIDWIPTNISSGIYVLRFESKSTIINKKITYLK